MSMRYSTSYCLSTQPSVAHNVTMAEHGTKHGKRTRREGTGRISKRRDFALQASWATIDAQRHHQDNWLRAHANENMPPRVLHGPEDPVNYGSTILDLRQFNIAKPDSKDHHAPHDVPTTVTCVTTLIPTDVHNRRNSRLERKHGSGRTTQLRSFTLQLSLPPSALPASPAAPALLPPPLSPHASPLQAAYTSNSNHQGTARKQAAHQSTSGRTASARSFQPFFLSHGTPIEGIPEWMPKHANTPSSVAKPSNSLSTSITPGFVFTPMEGVPERNMSTRRPKPQPPVEPTPFKYAVTPMEGLPEKSMAFGQTMTKLARLAVQRSMQQQAEAAAAQQLQGTGQNQQHGGLSAAGQVEQQEEEEEELIHRVGDDVLLPSAPPSPAPETGSQHGYGLLAEAQGAAGHAELRLAGATHFRTPCTHAALAAHAVVTPIGPVTTTAGAAGMPSHHEMQTQTGMSLGSMHVPLQTLGHAAGHGDQGGCDMQHGLEGADQDEEPGCHADACMDHGACMDVDMEQTRDALHEAAALPLPCTSGSFASRDPGGMGQVAAQQRSLAHSDDAQFGAAGAGESAGAGPSNVAAAADAAAAEEGAGPRAVVRAARKSCMGVREMEAMKRRKSLAGDGLAVDVAHNRRRSTRCAQRPLEYWRNECKVFGREHRSLPTVVRVETRTPNPSWPLTDKSKKQKQRARTKA